MARIAAFFAIIAAVGFAAGWFGNDRLGALLPWNGPPAWIGEYANSFCAADGAAIAARTGGEMEMTADEINDALQEREWSCDRVQYLGQSNGEEGQAYIFVLRDAVTGLENWWVFTVDGEKVVRID